MENVSLKFGPLQPLLHDESITEIMVNRHDRIFIEKNGKLHSTSFTFPSEEALLELIQSIAQYTGREISARYPCMDGYLPDGSRVNASMVPMAPRGANLTIRKFRKKPFTLTDYIQSGAISEKAAYFLHACVLARINIVVSGGTGTGKTTFLNSLSAAIPESERIISIEDVSELNLQHENWVRLEASFRPGERAVTTRDCLINALRMRPDRILVGECRRDETFEMLQAMNTGHDGSMTTVHANTSRDCLSRLESLILTSNIEMPLAALRKQMASAIGMIVQLRRLKNGQRVVQEITEITGMEQAVVTTQLLFSRDKKRGATGPDTLLATGLVPSFVEKISECGVQLPPNFFDANTNVTYQPD